jgi:transposase-like protein
MVIALVRNGRRVADVAASVEVPEATVFRWVRQEKIDRGEIPGTSSQ